MTTWDIHSRWGTHQPRNRTLVSAGSERNCERKTSLDGSGVDIPPCHCSHRSSWYGSMECCSFFFFLSLPVSEGKKARSVVHVTDRHRRVMIEAGGENGAKASISGTSSERSHPNLRTLRGLSHFLSQRISCWVFCCLFFCANQPFERRR